MLKYEYKIMYKAAKVQNLILNKIIGEKDEEIERLTKALRENQKFPYMESVD